MLPSNGAINLNFGTIIFREHCVQMEAFNKTFADIKNVIHKQIHMLSINEKLKKDFDKKPFIAYRRNKNLHQIIGGNRTNKNHKQSGKCSRCVSQLNNLCCKQVKLTKIYKSYGTNQVFKIFPDLTCKSEDLIYLVQ